MTNRIPELDIIRGYAIFGILVCNICLFGYPQEYTSEYLVNRLDWADKLASYIRFNFFGDKTFTVFSLLFGIGIGMQFQKDPVGFRKKHIFRMLTLLVIGLIHAFGLWFGDILGLYAILGIIVTAVMHLKTRHLIIISVLAFVWPTIQNALVRNGLSLLTFANDERLPLETLIDMNTNQGIMGHLRYNLMQILPTYQFYLSFTFYQSLSLVITGIIVAKLNLPQNIHKYLSVYRRIFIVSLFIVLVWHLYYLLFFDTQNMGNPINFYIYWGLFNLSNIGQTFLVVTGIVLALRSNHKWLRGICVFRYLGRLSLTNYLLHSVLGIIIFKLLGFYGQSSPAVDMLLVISFTVLQLMLSKLWLSKYTAGPMEWVWRTATQKMLSK